MQIQPPTLPREDLDALGVKYRRIPVMSIGRDIYCDSRLIIQKLEERFPDGALGATRPDEKAIERLLEKWCIDGGVFARTAQLLPTDLPLLNDPKFIKDREDFSGRSWAKAQVTSMRPEALAHMREMFDFLETGLLADGREWILKTEKPSLADIEGDFQCLLRYLASSMLNIATNQVSGHFTGSPPSQMLSLLLYSHQPNILKYSPGYRASRRQCHSHFLLPKSPQPSKALRQSSTSRKPSL